MTHRFFLSSFLFSFLGIFLCAFFGLIDRPVVFAATSQNGVVIQLTVLSPLASTTYSFSVTKSGTGSGTVTSADGMIDCGGTCFEANVLNGSSTVLTAIPDPGSTFDGWSTTLIVPTCTGTGTCTLATSTLVTATFNLVVVPPPPPTPGGSSPSSPIVGPSAPASFFFEDFSSNITTTSIVLNWYTTLPSVSNISWGLNSDGGLGSGSETSYSIPHSVELNNLSPDTSYTMTIRAVSQQGTVISDTYNFRTLPITNEIPLNVTDFRAQVSFGGNILLSWVNPFEPDFSSVIITRGTRFFPRDPGEGYLVYQGPEEEILDTNVVPGQNNFYSAFVINTEGVHSSGAVSEFALPVTVSTSTGGTVTGKPNSIFGGKTIPVGTTTLSVIFSSVRFIQNGVLIPEINSDVSADASQAVLVEIPAGDVPLNTEETTITLGTQTFIFEKLADGSLSALVPAILPAGSNPFTINFLQLGSKVKLTGDFTASGPSAPFQPMSISTYLMETYISNNFLCTTLPISLMSFMSLTSLILVVRILLKR